MVLTLPLSALRPNDILLMLALGGGYEILTCVTQMRTRAPSRNERTLRSELHRLRFETVKKRSLGPSAFVETAKLERQILANEKELASHDSGRSERLGRIRSVLKKVSTVVQVTIFLVYFGIPLLSIDGTRIPAVHTPGGDIVMAEDAANACLRGICFPFCVWLKLSAVGLAERASSVGALVVFWSAQVTIRMVLECVEVLWVR